MLKFHRQWPAISFFSSLGIFLSQSALFASPIVPQADSQTQVQQVGNEFTITGGVTSADGQALFHAFEQLGLSQGQIATFLAQPDVQSILGSVLGGDASYINGLLQVADSSADLYLINPAGILFGPNAQIDLAGSFAATTASGVLFDDVIFSVLSGDDFSQVAGTPAGFVFAMDEAGTLVNAADLNVAAGESITLIGSQVVSTGTLTAPGGEITIAAIPEAGIVRISHPDMVLNLEVATLPEGTIAGPHSTSPLSLPALLTGVPDSLATGVAVQPDGTIALTNSDTPVLPVAGSAIVSGSLNTASTQGGDVALVGDRVTLLDATVNANGDIGGGTVRIGGDFQGQPTLPGSSLTYVDASSRITANPGIEGNGGRVILWSDGTTSFAGEIAVNGGETSGDGGFVEVSGAQTLIYNGTVTAIAPDGQIGTLLLDPTDITIRNGMADGDDLGASDTLLTATDIMATDPGPSVIFESELENTPGTVDLAIRASNSITVEDLADDALTFQTDGVAPGSITFEAGGPFQMADANDAIVAPARSLTITAGTITAGHIDATSPSFSLPGGTVTLNAAGAIVAGDIVTLGDDTGAGSGDVVVTGSRSQAGRIRAGGGFANPSRVELTATSGDLIVETITAGGGGIDIDAAGRFQARDSFLPAAAGTELQATDTELIDFLTRGEPELVFDAGLVDSGDRVSVAIPTSILASPSTAGDGPISIRHGGQAATFSGDEITIQGTGANPDVQFVIGPNNDHTIDINTSVSPATGNFFGFTTLFPAGTFPDDVNGTTGAIIRFRGDAFIVTSFQNQPFVPIVEPPPGEMPGSTPGSTPGTTDPGSGMNGGAGGSPIADTIAADTTTLENLDEDSANSETLADAADSAELSTDEATAECEAVIASRSASRVEIEGTCEAPTSAETGE
ncbi:MAG: filamentous hemagglutinin N-terminal domain-containing protein [Cyanobacteria bacterium P01_C01_bin.70]